MAKDNSFVQYIIQDVLSDVSGVTFKNMFGGYGLYKDGVIFGMVIDDQVYFKVGETNIKDYEEAHSTPFTYHNSKKEVKTSYYTVPEDVLEDRDQIKSWVQKSLEVSLAKRLGKK